MTDDLPVGTQECVPNPEGFAQRSESRSLTCGKCGDRVPPDQQHDCWVLRKRKTQENLAGPAYEFSTCAPLRRDDGTPVPDAPAWISDRVGRTFSSSET